MNLRYGFICAAVAASLLQTVSAAPVNVTVERTIRIGSGGPVVSGSGSFQFDPSGDIPSAPIAWDLKLTQGGSGGCAVVSNPHIAPMTATLASVSAKDVIFEIRGVPHRYILRMRCGTFSPPPATLEIAGGVVQQKISLVDSALNTNRWWSMGDGYAEDKYEMGPLCPPDLSKPEELKVQMPPGLIPQQTVRKFSMAVIEKVANGMSGNTGFYGANLEDLPFQRGAGPIALTNDFEPRSSRSKKGCFYVKAVTARYLPLTIWIPSEFSDEKYAKAASCVLSHEQAHAVKLRELVDRHRQKFESMLTEVPGIPTSRKPVFSEDVKADVDRVTGLISDALMKAFGLPSDKGKWARLDSLRGTERDTAEARRALNPYRKGSFFADSWDEDVAASDSTANYTKIYDACGPWPP